MKIGDYIIIALSFIVVVLLFFNSYIAKPRGKIVEVITIEGPSYYNLYDKREIKAKGPLGYSFIKIADGEVWMESSPCPEKICVKTGKISRVGQQIVCLPNRVFIEVEGGSSEVDAVSR